MYQKNDQDKSPKDNIENNRSNQSQTNREYTGNPPIFVSCDRRCDCKKEEVMICLSELADDTTNDLSTL